MVNDKSAEGCLSVRFLFFEFLTLKGSLSVLERTPVLVSEYCNYSPYPQQHSRIEHCEGLRDTRRPHNNNNKVCALLTTCPHCLNAYRRSVKNTRLNTPSRLLN